jgi:hypothetical protein
MDWIQTADEALARGLVVAREEFFLGLCSKEQWLQGLLKGGG